MIAVSPHAPEDRDGAGARPPESVRSDRCAHCGESLREQRLDGDPRFCCAGCAAVWKLLHANHLEHVYELHDREGVAPNRPVPGGMHEHLDHPAFQDRHVERTADGTLQCEFRVDGMRCGACLWLLESVPRLVPGTRGCRVDMGRGTIRVQWRPEAVRLSTIVGTIEGLGYGVRALGAPGSRAAWQAEDRAWLVKLGVAGAIAGNAMAIAFVLYGAQVAWMDQGTRQFLQWTSVGLGLVSVVWPGRIYFRNAWVALRSGRPHVDAPIALALLAGLVGGAVMTALGKPGIYVESVTMLVFLLLVGRVVQFRQQRRARHEVELLCALVPQVAHRRAEDGRLERVPTDALVPGDLAEVPAGDAIPADGTLVSPEARVDMQLLTGESRPERLEAGAVLHAGTRAVLSPLLMRVERTGADTRAGHIAAMVDRAMGERSEAVEFANRIAGWFLAGVVALAIVTGVIWWQVDPSRMLSVCMALLVVTCPCALGLATPLTMVAGIGKAARAGILVRGGWVFELLARPGTVVLDKTGTLTEGRTQVVDMQSLEPGDAGPWLAMAVAVERSSTHPVGEAVCMAARCAAVQAMEATGRAEWPGEGVTGWIGDRHVAVGNERLMRRCGIWIPDSARLRVREAVERFRTPVLVSVGGAVRLVLSVGDRLRSDSERMVRGLRDRGWRVLVASGDLPQITHEVARRVGMMESDAHGGLSPEAKLELVRSRRERPVLVVGDGVNDLPAMAAADAGVSMRQGAQITLDRADVAMSGGGLMPLLTLIDGSASVRRTVRINFGISLACIVVGGALAVTGLINPIIAAVLMPLSGLMVTAVVLRMPQFHEVRA